MNRLIFLSTILPVIDIAHGPLRRSHTLASKVIKSLQDTHASAQQANDWEDIKKQTPKNGMVGCFSYCFYAKN